MEDEAYPEYLKKQSYEDLLLISSSIEQTRQAKDQRRQAQRYAMVMAEIDRRDKSGEGKDSPNDPTKRYRKYGAIAIGTLFALTGLFEVYTGHFYTKGFHDISRSQDPVGFWMSVGIEFAFAIFAFALAIYRAKK